MAGEKIREWEKGSANPIPDSKYERYKEKLVESQNILYLMHLLFHQLLMLLCLASYIPLL